MSVLGKALEQAEGFLELGMGDQAWEALEDLPTESKNHPRVLELRLQILISLRQWAKAEILGDSLAGLMPRSIAVWIALARAKAQLGKRVEALRAIEQVVEQDPSRRLELVADDLLAGVW